MKDWTLRLGEFELEMIGDDLVRVSGVDIFRLRQLGRSLRSTGEWIEVVDGISDLVIQFDTISLTADDARKLVQDCANRPMSVVDADESLVELSVAFGGDMGPDLSDVCGQLNLSAEELISRICSADLRVDVVGFTPGFAYISGIPEALSVPRLREPRKRVPAGSFGFAAGKCGTYALEGPGGWPIIGRVQNVLFDSSREDPFLLKAGQRVKVCALDPL